MQIKLVKFMNIDSLWRNFVKLANSFTARISGHVAKNDNLFGSSSVLWMAVIWCAQWHKSYCTFGQVNVIGPWSSFTVTLTSWRFSVLVEGLWRNLASGTPATILNCKHLVSPFHCSHGAFGNGVLSMPVMFVQDLILSFQWWNCTISSILKASQRNIT